METLSSSRTTKFTPEEAIAFVNSLDITYKELKITKALFNNKNTQLTSEIGTGAGCGQRLIRIVNNKRTHDFIFNRTNGRTTVYIENNNSKCSRIVFENDEQFSKFVDYVVDTIGFGLVYTDYYRARTKDGERKDSGYYEVSENLGRTMCSTEADSIIKQSLKLSK